MVMVINARVIPAGVFKAKCLAILDEVALTGESVVVTKRGKPVAKVVPIDEKAIRGVEGSIVSEGDLISPVGDEWEASS